MKTTPLLLLALAALAAPLCAQNRPADRLSARVVLGPDDKPAFPPAPAGFDQRRPDIPKGKVETAEYDSKSVGTKRKLSVYTPPGYTSETKHPVLYLLHGIGGNEREWLRGGAADVILDNLLADKKIVPMIVVMPNGRAQPDDRAVGDVFKSAPAFGRFDQDLLGSIIPFIESRYAVKTGPENRALAGLSMGGGQTLNFGLGNPATFGWVGAFSSAPNTRKPADLLAKPETAARDFKLIWLSCGDKDGLMDVSQGVHKYLKENNVPHLWHVSSGPHTFEVWKQDLHHFSQKLFR